jgi:hypothetical protein
LRQRLAIGGLILACVLAPPAFGVVIVSEPGSGNTSAPPDDPGFARVGWPAVATVVYVGNGWVLTANHVGDTDVTIGGVVYPRVPGSRVTFTNPDQTVPDLSAFRIDPYPDLGILPIRATTPPVGTPVVMVGHGLDRGAPTSWMGYDGFWTLPAQSVRWGTNHADGSGTILDTAAFVTVLDAGGSEHEAQGVYGDSGGPVFTKRADGTWELAGIMFTVGTYENQPSSYVLYGNATYAVDVSAYRDQIIAVVRPECSDEVENDGDGYVDFPQDPGCSSAEDRFEIGDCTDGIDNDGDGLLDYPADPGCRGTWQWSRENPACDDDVDNDGDSLVDIDDPECAASPPWWKNEAVVYHPSCGLGFELVLVIPPLAALRRRRAG